MTQKTSIPASIVLLAAFALFNVGMPVSFYLCSMMSDEAPMCDLSPAGSTGLSITSITPDCCAKVFVAERKTTPFLKTADGILDLDWTCVAAIGAPTIRPEQILFAEAFSFNHTADSPPLFLLHSSLLI